MSCCPTAPQITVGGSSDDYDLTATTEPHLGESSECYIRRAGNPTGKHDDATDYPPDRIKNSDIPLTMGETVDVTFIMTPGSVKVPTSWTFVPKETPLPAGVTFTSSGATARLAGTFPKESHGKMFKFELTALAGAEVIDAKGFVFSPAKITGSNEIRFVHPLPGGMCNSPFSSARMHPVDKIVKPHHGADFVMKDRSIGDVVAAADGVVLATPYQAGGAGNYIKIKHLNAAGSHLCTTVYMHLSAVHVADGQHVVAGQKIGREGSTGSSTGNHLHFECRLPNGDRIDPVPLIKGTVQVAGQTTPGNKPVPGTVVEVETNAALTPENVQAKQDGCEPFGPTYPKARNPPGEAPVPPDGSVFDKAWFFTMTEEVGPAWTVNSPNDPEIAAGLANTPAQKKKVGLNLRDKRGGTTKFGIANNFNTDLKVAEMDYATAKKRGYNGYWIGRPNTFSGSSPKLAVMLFDMTFLHGAGGVGNILQKLTTDIGDMPVGEAVEALSQAQLKYMLSLPGLKANPGWLPRREKLLAYARTIT